MEEIIPQHAYQGECLWDPNQKPKRRVMPVGLSSTRVFSASLNVKDEKIWAMRVMIIHGNGEWLQQKPLGEALEETVQTAGFEQKTTGFRIF